MSKRRFTNVDRRSIMEAHGARCFHCNAPIDYQQLEIDHLIPEALLADESGLFAVLRRYDLPEDFDLNGDQNLVPSCNACNGKKSNLLINPNQIAIYLALTQARAGKVAELRKKYGRRILTNKLFLDLVGAYEAGTTNPKEIDRLTRKYFGDSTVKLSYPLNFVRAPDLTVLNRADLEDFRDAELLIFDTPGGIELEHDDGRKLEVRTCRQYSDAICEGFYAYLNSSIKLSSHFETALHVLHALENAEFPEKSFISDPRIGLCDLRFLPISLVSISPDIEAEIPREVVSIEDARGVDVLEILEFSSLSLTVSCGHFITTFRELLRSDLNGDGVEEILVAVYGQAVGGTMGFGYCVTLGRDDDDTLLRDLSVMLPHDVAAKKLADAKSKEFQNFLETTTSNN